jgi:hypothetical protein
VCVLYFTHSQNKLLTQNAVYFMFIVINIPSKLLENKTSFLQSSYQKKFIDVSNQYTKIEDKIYVITFHIETKVVNKLCYQLIQDMC